MIQFQPCVFGHPYHLQGCPIAIMAFCKFKDLKELKHFSCLEEDQELGERYACTCLRMYPRCMVHEFTT